MNKKEELFELVRGMYFRRDGTPYENMMQWAEDFGKGVTLRRVDETILWWGGRVSTVWLGLNHNFDFNGPPLIFETMVFPPHGFREFDAARYSSETQACAGHRAMVKRWKYGFGPIIRVWVWCLLDELEQMIKR